MHIRIRIRIQLKILMRIRIQIRGGGGGVGVGQPKMCIPPDKILGTPLAAVFRNRRILYFFRGFPCYLYLPIRGEIRILLFRQWLSLLRKGSFFFLISGFHQVPVLTVGIITLI
jgi:hypothetical protein